MRSTLIKYVLGRAGVVPLEVPEAQPVSFLDNDDELLEKSYVNEVARGFVSARFLRWIDNELEKELDHTEARMTQAIEELAAPRFNIGTARKKRAALIQTCREYIAQLRQAEQWVATKAPDLPEWPDSTADY